MKNLQDYRSEYKKLKISKFEYSKRIYYIHKYLFQYSDDLKNTDISSIEITDKEVIMTFRDSLIKMLLMRGDTSIPPLAAFNLGQYEKEELDVAVSTVKKNLGRKKFVLMDVGANVGWFSLHIAKLFRNSRIFAIEPMPHAYDCLKRNIKLNKLDNIRTFKIGFSDKKAAVEFYCEPKRCSSSSMKNITGTKEVEIIKAQTETMDSFTESRRIQIDFIKCDVEGAEYLVLKGGLRSLTRDKPIIFIELLRKWSAKYNYQPNDVIKMLRQIGYSCYRINNCRLVRFDKMTENTKETNFFFLDKKKHRI